MPPLVPTDSTHTTCNYNTPHYSAAYNLVFFYININSWPPDAYAYLLVSY